jgi:archaemetzincin
MKKLFYLIGLLIILLLFGYFVYGLFKTPTQNNIKKNNKKTQIKKIKKTNTVIFIQPLGDVNQEYLKLVKESVESFYHFDCIIKETKPLTNDLLTVSGVRYSAGKILKKFDTKQNYLILTEKDIATSKNQYPEWGILGLGYRPGTTCVVSTFRMKRNVNENIVKDRLKKVALHEIGHNLGLGHCDNNPHCMMNDAKGTITQVDLEKIWLCEKCNYVIKK